MGMICLNETVLPQVMSVLVQLAIDHTEEVGAFIRIGNGVELNEVVAYLDPDLGRAADGVTVPGYPLIRVWVAPDFDNASDTLVFNFRPILKNGREWFEIYQTAVNLEEQYVCFQV